MQQEICSLLKNKWDGGDYGWFSNRQILDMCISSGFDVEINIVIIATKKLTRSRFIDREYVKGMGVFRFKPINKKYKRL